MMIVGNVMVCTVTFAPVIGGTVDNPITGTPDDPQKPVVFSLTLPDGSKITETYGDVVNPNSIVRDARGVYHRNVDCQQEGGYIAEFSAGPGYLEAASLTRWVVGAGI